ncbi:MAG: hypothetical protein BMS9Abin29_2102 [Gemmatimonadota bacterium]|nr:MAG: hypothetical protein BMS9Abin29_2102 [Gemmatimonadota bacterium]
MFLGTLIALTTTAAAWTGPTEPAAQQGEYLYRVLTVRAAPGRLLDLIDLYKEQREILEAVGDGEVFWMRHSQGDQWDLLLMFPMGSFADYYSAARVRDREQGRGTSGRTGAEIQKAIDAASSWREELFARGPGVDALRERFAGAGLFHIEMFIALHDKRDELLAQRNMENAYYRALDRNQNLIFVREAGAAWDLFTLGSYDDLEDFASAGDIPEEEEERAAREAGFEAANRIGTYLRSLMLRHNDTLARPVG